MPVPPTASDHPDTWRFDYVVFHPETRADLRAWMEANHDQVPGAWIVSWKKATGRPYVPYPEYVEELLCWGWIDSTNAKLDVERGLQLSTPRKAKSPWSRLNRRRVNEQDAAGQMTDAGWRAVQMAKANGWWTIADDVEDLIVPADLALALDAVPAAREAWDGFNASPRKQMLWWVKSAVRDETRAKRIQRIAEDAAEGRPARG